MYFTTTRRHHELNGGTFVDIIIGEAHDPASDHRFRGNVDPAKLDALAAEVGADMTRVSENAYFVQTREPGPADKTIGEFTYEICALTDAATMAFK